MTNACPVLSVCQEFVSLCCFFRKRGSFFLSWIYLEALAWSESSVCHYCLFLISHVHLQDFVAIANQWLQSGVWPQDGEKENRSNSAKEHKCCGGQYIPQKMGWSLPSNISFVCDCWWLLRVSLVQSRVGNETFWIPSGSWGSLDLLDQRFWARYWDPCLVLSWVSEIKGSLSEKE